ncbi:serpin family protein [Myxococcus sp. K38C18041901]|uniref:serpin family protein n=1 Tax=Myxococcus guangdongensis TaxID=2906760 RepID=UPI0020A77842|nr:serpin family protein [Myxococcus guangdongensis]MCP3064988.1 serpin family protein [Myxococcus guangdongensis]
MSLKACMFAVVWGLAGCHSDAQSPAEREPPPPGTLVTSEKDRVKSPSVSDTDFAALVSGNTDFGVALYRRVTEPGKNAAVSPLSVTRAFSLVYAGARGDTQSQMARVLGFTLPAEHLHPALNRLDLALQEQVGQAHGDEGPAPTFRAVNALWGQQGYRFEPSYLDVLAEHHGAGLRSVDFTVDPDGVCRAINDWVSGVTADRIQDLIPQGEVRADTRLVLANALYFKGAWRTPFQAQATSPKTFHGLTGGTTQVPMMHTSWSFPFTHGEGYDAIALPYVGRAFRMLVIVPDAGRFQEVEQRLSAAFLDSVRANLSEQPMLLRFPRFEVKQSAALVDALRSLGMEDAFSDRADLSGITRQEQLMLSGAQHQAFVAVDEAGTEAAAATAIEGVPASLPPEVHVDRPFVFVIEEVATKSVLFLGRVVSP